jgi:predicted SnoaL-like aldol condensation-catalyzing enzyme
MANFFVNNKSSKIIVAFVLLTLSSLSFSASETSIDENKKLVVEFYENILFKGQFDKIDQYIGKVYIQHNPGVADGKQALLDMLKSFGPVKDTPGEIIRVVAENDLVVLHVKYYNFPTKRGSSVIDIFRIENGLIVEHWDTMQAVPEKSANSNSMF